jgi:putative acetyltransferase
MNPPFTIRGETPMDRPAVRAVNQAAFDGDAEADLVAWLWDEGDALFGLVAKRDGVTAGHILFSRLPIEMPNGEQIPAAALAPLAVAPEWQRRGLGSALVRQGLERCRERGLTAVVVLGDPAYYSRFGFRTELAQALQTPWSGPYLMAVELVPGVLAGRDGIPHYASAFGRLER